MGSTDGSPLSVAELLRLTFFATGLPLLPFSGDGVPMTSSTALALASAAAAAGGLSVSVRRFLGLVRFGSNSLEIPLKVFRILRKAYRVGHVIVT